MKEPFSFLMERLMMKRDTGLLAGEFVKSQDHSTIERLQCSSYMARIEKHILMLQKAITCHNASLTLDHLENTAKQFKLKFSLSTMGNEVSIASDMFTLHFILDSSGLVAKVELANDDTVEDIPDLRDAIQSGHFELLFSHVSGLLSFYSLGEDIDMKRRAFEALKSMESELNMLSNLQSSVANVSTYIHKSPLGILVPRSGGMPIRLIFFVCPYDLLNFKNRSSIPMTIEAIIENKIGLSASVIMENSRENFKVLRSSTDTLHGGSHKSLESELRFLLCLDRPMPLSASVIERIEQITGLKIETETATLQPIPALLLEQKANHRARQHLCCWKWHAVVTLSGERHQYFISCSKESSELSGAFVSKIPFTCSSMCPPVIALLRQQALFNAILSSCIRRRCHCGHDLKRSLTFEVTPLSVRHLTVTWEHRSSDMLATAEIDLTDLMAVECRMRPEFLLTQGNKSCSNLATRVLQRSLSLPIMLRFILSKTSSMGSTISHLLLENTVTDVASEICALLGDDVVRMKRELSEDCFDELIADEENSTSQSETLCFTKKQLSPVEDAHHIVSSSANFLPVQSKTNQAAVTFDDVACSKVSLNPVLASLLEPDLPNIVPISTSHNTPSMLSVLLSDSSIQPPSLSPRKSRKTGKRSNVHDRSSPVRKSTKLKLVCKGVGIQRTVTPNLPNSVQQTPCISSPSLNSQDSLQSISPPTLSKVLLPSASGTSSNSSCYQVPGLASESAVATISSGNLLSSVDSYASIATSFVDSSASFHPSASFVSPSSVHLPLNFIPQSPLTAKTENATHPSKPETSIDSDSAGSRKSVSVSNVRSDVYSSQAIVLKNRLETDFASTSSDVRRTSGAGPVKDAILTALLSERESDDSASVSQNEEEVDGIESFVGHQKINSGNFTDGLKLRLNKGRQLDQCPSKVTLPFVTEPSSKSSGRSESGTTAIPKPCSVVIFSGVDDKESVQGSNLNTKIVQGKQNRSICLTSNVRTTNKFSKGQILKEILEQGEGDYEISLDAKESLLESYLGMKQGSKIEQEDRTSNHDGDIGAPGDLDVVASTSVGLRVPKSATVTSVANLNTKPLVREKLRFDQKSNSKGSASSALGMHVLPSAKRQRRADSKRFEANKRKKLYDFHEENETCGDNSIVKSECQDFLTTIKITKSSGSLRVQKTPSAAGSIVVSDDFGWPASADVHSSSLSATGFSSTLKTTEKTVSGIKLWANQHQGQRTALNRSKSDSHSLFGNRSRSDSKLYKTAMIKLKPVCVPSSVRLTTNPLRTRCSQSAVLTSCKPSLATSMSGSKMKSLQKSAKGSLSAVIDKLTRQHSLPVGSGSAAVTDNPFERVNQQKDLYDAIRLEIIREGNKPSTPTKEITLAHTSNQISRRWDRPKPSENGSRLSYNTQNTSPSPAGSCTAVYNNSNTLFQTSPSLSMTACSGLDATRSGFRSIAALSGNSSSRVRDLKLFGKAPSSPKTDLCIANSKAATGSNGTNIPVESCEDVMGCDVSCEPTFKPSATGHVSLLLSSGGSVCESSTPFAAVGSSLTISENTTVVFPKCSDVPIVLNQEQKSDECLSDRGGVSRHFMDPLISLTYSNTSVEDEMQPISIDRHSPGNSVIETSNSESAPRDAHRSDLNSRALDGNVECSSVTDKVNPATSGSGHFSAINHRRIFPVNLTLGVEANVAGVVERREVSNPASQFTTAVTEGTCLLGSLSAFDHHSLTSVETNSSADVAFPSNSFAHTTNSSPLIICSSNTSSRSVGFDHSSELSSDESKYVQNFFGSCGTETSGSNSSTGGTCSVVSGSLFGDVSIGGRHSSVVSILSLPSDDGHLTVSRRPDSDVLRHEVPSFPVCEIPSLVCHNPCEAHVKSVEPGNLMVALAEDVPKAPVDLKSLSDLLSKKSSGSVVTPLSESDDDLMNDALVL